MQFLMYIMKTIPWTTLIDSEVQLTLEETKSEIHRGTRPPTRGNWHVRIKDTE